MTGEGGTALTELFVADEHSPLYDLWRERGDRDLSVCHVDFHCDMRGLLIDKRRGRARYVWQSDPYMNRLDSGSFLAHAVMKGMVSRLRWVHDEFAGRKYDDLYCVKYETDCTSLPFRLAGKRKWVPLDFSEHTFDDWGGPRPGEYLSLDWDGFAFVDYDEAHIRRLTTEFLKYEFRPESVFVSSSPEYCHPDKALFDEFIGALEKKFRTQAVRLPSRQHAPLAPSRPWIIYHGIEYRILRLMRKWGIY
jgi:hypothetical protein